MDLLQPNWNQKKPSCQDAQTMCSVIALHPVAIENEAVIKVLERLRATHLNGGALFAAVHIGESDIFDWFASRNRILEYDILPLLLRRNEIRGQLSELSISDTFLESNRAETCATDKSGGFSFDNPFLLDGQLAQPLFRGGAYGAREKIDGKTAMHLAAEYCEALFERRYEEISLYTSYEAWTPWFEGIAWDWTSILFDRRGRNLWILAVTDTD